MGGRIITLHVSDYDFVDERHLLPGEGKNPWGEILRALEEVGYDGRFTYEVRAGNGAAVAENFRWLMGQ